MNPSGQVAVVTGGGSGLGEATARALAAKGAQVALLDVGIKNAEEVAADIGGIAIKCDVSNAEAGEAAFEEVAARLGAPRILVNCAGIGIAMKTTGKEGAHPLDLYRKVIEVNLIGTFNMIRLFAVRAETQEPLDGGERGVIVNTASVAAYDGQIGQAAYSSSKGGVVGMTLPIARDLSNESIRVNTILPGLFNTPLLAGAPENVKAALSATVLNPKRLGDPPEYAALAMLMIENGYFNGECVRLDGGIRMQPR